VAGNRGKEERRREIRIGRTNKRNVTRKLEKEKTGISA
jgi:hypothetical protein